MEADELESMMEELNNRAASDMLEDAIQHFDNIIDKTALTNGTEQQYGDNEAEEVDNGMDSGIHGVAMLMEDLRNAVEATLDVEITNDIEGKLLSETLLRHLSPDTVIFYRKLLALQISDETESDKVKRLVAENDSLSLQVSVLNDQVELQTEKLQELDEQLLMANKRLDGADARLREEVQSKTSLETQKLQLMNEMSNYKIDLAQKQQQKKQDEAEFTDLEAKRIEMESRNDQYKQLLDKLNTLKRKVVDVERAKVDSSSEVKILQTLIAKLEESSAEKDRTIEDLQERLLLVKANPASNATSPDEGIVRDHDEKRMLQLKMPAPYATSTPITIEDKSKEIVQSSSQGRAAENVADDRHASPPATPKSSMPSATQGMRSSSLAKLNRLSLEESSVTKSASQEVLTSKQGNLRNNTSGSNDVISGASPSKVRGGWGGGAKSTPRSKSNSTPNLAMTEIRQPESVEVDGTPARPSPLHQRKKHGFRKFFTSFRLRRTRSTSLEQSPPPNQQPPVQPEEQTNNFKRGGLRSTAGPRLGWNPRDLGIKNRSSVSDDTPFARWDTERVCQWLIDIGLHVYVQPCKKWIKSGETLLRATNHDLEKELGIRNPLHKKKLMLHLQAQGSDEEAAGAGQMDAVWVARWLDDIGLPQYKDAFHEACIDGRVLHHLTVSDAQKLKVTNLFHLLSFRRAIEVLRKCEFEPTSLRRRPLDDQQAEDVSLWTTHRVMEWLRSIDLAEYAPNLRGSGVHGAVLVLEPLFTAETIASLLNIPQSKSLLRRHLAAKLKELLPEDSTQAKELRSKEPGYQPVSTTIKYKVGRRSFASFGRFRGSSAAHANREFGSGEYVCPMSSNAKSKTLQTHRSELERKIQIQSGNDVQPSEDTRDAENTSASGSDNIEVVELNESTTREINAFSAQLNSLTSNWKEL